MHVSSKNQCHDVMIFILFFVFDARILCKNNNAINMVIMSSSLIIDTMNLDFCNECANTRKDVTLQLF